MCATTLPMQQPEGTMKSKSTGKSLSHEFSSSVPSKPIARQEYIVNEENGSSLYQRNETSLVD